MNSRNDNNRHNSGGDDYNVVHNPNSCQRHNRRKT